MKFALVSDIHLEFGDYAVPEVDANVLINCGDLATANSKAGIEWLRKAGEVYEKVLFVPGNHEFYGGEYHEELERLKTFIGRMNRVELMHNAMTFIGNVRIIGTTLWTNGEKRVLSDFYVIRWGNELFSVDKARELHRQQVKFLRNMLAAKHTGPTVVMTHHAPIPECVHPRFIGSDINCMFHANLNKLIAEHKIDFWLHGHMHDFRDLEYEGTRILCNPRGYARYENTEGYEPYLFTVR
jgi:Icc-related predicted phosphoesterase